MFKNYFNTALRFLKKNKLYSVINTIGLATALSVSFIILLFVINELSYDHYHKNRKRVFRVVNYYKDTDKTVSSTPYILASALKEEFPQIEKAIRIMPIGLTLKLNTGLIPTTAICTDSEIFDVFTLPMVDGSFHKNLLEDKNSIVLSKELGEKVFPGQNPIGKEIMASINNEDQLFIVKGVFENIPENSTFKAQCLLNSKWTVDYINKKFNITNAEVSWDKDLWITWVLVSKGCNTESLNTQFKAFEIKNIGKNLHPNYSLQNLSDVYLGSDKILNSGIRGNINNIKIFLAIALLIIIVAAINYVILSTAVSTVRTKEIGMRKAYGASIFNIRSQFLSESILMTAIVLPIALLLMWLTLPSAGKLFQTELHILRSNITFYILIYVVFTIIIGVIAGFYTSAYLSRLKVLDIINQTAHSGKRKHFFRSSMIVIQLFIFCSLMSGTLIMRSQYQFAINKDLGYYNHNILLVDLGRDFKDYSSYLNSIKSNPDVIMASGAIDRIPMLNTMSMVLPNFHNKDTKVEVQAIMVDYNFLKTMGITVMKGRDFSEEFGSDPSQSIILNETAVKRLGLIDPIGKTVANQIVIGVVKDFNLHSIYSEIPPLMIALTGRNLREVVVHYKPETIGSVLPMIEAEWKKSTPDKPFSYTTIEGIIKNLYSSEKNLTLIVSIFALITLLIAAFGLFGLTLYLARSRTKEIGIKKVYGCSEKSIVYSFLWENFILVSLSAVLSVPFTLNYMIKWLSKFSYKMTISWWVFVLTYLIAAIVVLLTVCYHSYKASRINPVKALRSE